MGRKGPRAKTKTVLKPVKQWENHGSMLNSELLTFFSIRITLCAFVKIQDLPESFNYFNLTQFNSKLILRILLLIRDGWWVVEFSCAICGAVEHHQVKPAVRQHLLQN